MLGNGHVRFGGRVRETDRAQARSIKRSTTAFTSGCPMFAGKFMKLAKSEGPMKIPSMFGTPRISSIFSTAFGVSI